MTRNVGFSEQGEALEMARRLAGDRGAALPLADGGWLADLGDGRVLGLRATRLLALADGLYRLVETESELPPSDRALAALAAEARATGLTAEALDLDALAADFSRPALDALYGRVAREAMTLAGRARDATGWEKEEAMVEKDGTLSQPEPGVGDRPPASSYKPASSFRHGDLSAAARLLRDYAEAAPALGRDAAWAAPLRDLAGRLDESRTTGRSPSLEDAAAVAGLVRNYMRDARASSGADPGELAAWEKRTEALAARFAVQASGEARRAVAGNVAAASLGSALGAAAGVAATAQAINTIGAAMGGSALGVLPAGPTLAANVATSKALLSALGAEFAAKAGLAGSALVTAAAATPPGAVVAAGAIGIGAAAALAAKRSRDSRLADRARTAPETLTTPAYARAVAPLVRTRHEALPEGGFRSSLLDRASGATLYAAEGPARLRARTLLAGHHAELAGRALEAGRPVAPRVREGLDGEAGRAAAYSAGRPFADLAGGRLGDLTTAQAVGLGAAAGAMGATAVNGATVAAALAGGRSMAEIGAAYGDMALRAVETVAGLGQGILYSTGRDTAPRGAAPDAGMSAEPPRLAADAPAEIRDGVRARLKAMGNGELRLLEAATLEALAKAGSVIAGKGRFPDLVRARLETREGLKEIRQQMKLRGMEPRKDPPPQGRRQPAKDDRSAGR
jgi:hypothetical protein